MARAISPRLRPTAAECPIPTPRGAPQLSRENGALVDESCYACGAPVSACVLCKARPSAEDVGVGVGFEGPEPKRPNSARAAPTQAASSSEVCARRSDLFVQLRYLSAHYRTDFRATPARTMGSGTTKAHQDDLELRALCDPARAQAIRLLAAPRLHRGRVRVVQRRTLARERHELGQVAQIGVERDPGTRSQRVVARVGIHNLRFSSAD